MRPCAAPRRGHGDRTRRKYHPSRTWTACFSRRRIINLLCSCVPQANGRPVHLELNRGPRSAIKEETWRLLALAASMQVWKTRSFPCLGIRCSVNCVDHSSRLVKERVSFLLKRPLMFHEKLEHALGATRGQVVMYAFVNVALWMSASSSSFSPDKPKAPQPATTNFASFDMGAAKRWD